MTAEAGAWERRVVGGGEAVVEERRRRPLGALLVEAGVASEDDVRDALDEGNRRGERLGEVVLRRGWISERKLTKLLAEQWGLRAPGPVKMQVDPAALARIDAGLAAELGGIPFEFDQDGLVVAVAEPKTDRFEALRALLGNVSFVVVAPSTLTELLDARAALSGTTSSPAERVGAWLRPRTDNAQTAEQTNGHDLPDKEAPLDEAKLEDASTALVEETHPRDLPNEIPLNDATFEEEPMATMEQFHEETQPPAHEPIFTAPPESSSVAEHLHTLIRSIEALEHELVEKRRRLRAQETEIAELRQARASDLDTISNLGTELEQRRQRMDALRTVTRQLANELNN
jgi:type II secretion system (T2SS) protein E